ncbi:MAG: hypothetical protein MPN21_22855 [Thermoanaerobaculia bacterium]|nr:hypothetical protein [Thermoanaerobaculia bacterium]
MRRCAFLTLDDRSGYVIDDELAIPAMAEAGWQVDSVPWRAAVDWNEWEAVLIRSPWDYQDDPAGLLSVLEAIDSSTARLANSLETVRWNLRKTYLRDLETRGATVVPTLWGLDAPPTVASLRATFEAEEFQPELEGRSRGIVVKPVVSANADDTFVLRDDASDDQLKSIAGTFTLPSGAVRPHMVQPFLRRIVDEGEVSLFFFGGDFSHAVVKTPRRGDFRVQEEHGGRIVALDVDLATRRRIDRCADKVMAAIRPTPLYARVDLVRMAGGDFAVMELELIEPSLYFRMDPDAPRRFVDAFVRWMRC